MATKSVQLSVFTRAPLQWKSQKVTFSTSHGKNIQLSENNTVVTRITGKSYGIVYTNKPVSIGQMFKVTVMETEMEGGSSALSLVSQLSVCSALLDFEFVPNRP